MPTLSLKERLQRGDLCTGTFLLFLSGGDVVQFLAGLHPFQHLALVAVVGKVLVDAQRRLVHGAKGAQGVQHQADTRGSQVRTAMAVNSAPLSERM